MSRRRAGHAALLASALGLSAVGAGCRRQNMADQPRYEALEKSRFFSDGQSARLPVEGTVARGRLVRDPVPAQGETAETMPDGFPFPIGLAELRRGRERYDIFCSPCHGRLGAGDGAIVERGLRPPPSLLLDRLREAPAGHFYDVMTNGFGAMYSYASRVPSRDRWLIAAYIRALQLGGATPLSELSPDERRRVEEAR